MRADGAAGPTGGGSSLEVTDLRADRTLASAWADSDESAKAPWTTVSVSGPLDLGYAGSARADRVQLSSWARERRSSMTWRSRRARAETVVNNGGFESGLAGWTLQGNQSRSTLAQRPGIGGGNALPLRASDDGDPEGNRVFAALTTTTRRTRAARSARRPAGCAGIPR